MTQIDKWLRFALVTALLCLIGILTGCTRFTDTIPLPPAPDEYALYGSRTIGQMFVCHHAGLNEISILLWAQKGAGELVLHLREDVESTVDLATVAISPPPSDVASYQKFAFPVQDDVNGQSFFILLEAPDATAEAAFYIPHGLDQMSRYNLSVGGDSLLPGQMSFQLYYNTLYIVKDLFRQTLAFGLESVWLLFLSALFYLLPGGAAVVWLLQEGDWIERVIVALGTSVSLYALLVYATMTGLRLSALTVIGFLALCGALIGVRWWLDRQRTVRGTSSWRDWVRNRWVVLRRDPTYWACGAVVLLVLGVRIWATRDMVAPRWGDSYQHTMIVQLMLDHGGLFESWEPYAPYTGLTVHFGFHANAAMFGWLSGIGAMQSVIWVGQVLNVMAVLALYPLSKRIGGRWSGVLALLVSGLLTTTPMVYVNWGRYPQLAGQVILPIAAWLLWELLDRSSFDWRLLVLNAVAIVGQLFGYYRMPYYYAVWVLAAMLSIYLPKVRFGWRQWGRIVLHMGILGAITALALVPWGVHLAQSRIASSMFTAISPQRKVDLVRTEYEQWRTIDEYIPVPLLIAAGLAFLWSVLGRARSTTAVGIWAIGISLLVAGRLIGLPGAAKLSVFAAMIFMYAPIGLLVGWLGAKVISLIGGRWPGWGYTACAGLLILLALWGAYRMSTVPSASYDLVTPADLRAMAWIRTHVPANARFLVNGFLIYNGSSIVGSDAGWWIPLLTGRENTMPPQYALFNERELQAGYSSRLVDLVVGLREAPLSTPSGLRLACEQRVTHVYVGQVNGQVGFPPPVPLFTAEEMLSHPAFEVLYHRDKVWILSLTEAACQP